MSEMWREAPLAEMADITMGQSPESSCVASSERGLPFLQGCAEFGDRTPKPVLYCSPPLRTARAGSTLISVRAPVGTTNIADQDYCIGRGLGAVCAKPMIADNSFLLYAIEQNVGFLHRRSQGSTFSAISSKELASLPVPRLARSTQRQIARILTTLDNAIEHTESLISKYRQIKSGLMHDLFTRGVLPNGKLRPAREEAPGIYKESVLGWIPREWEVTELRNLTRQIGDGIHTTPVYADDSDYFFINGNNLKDGRIVTKGANCISQSEYKKLGIDLRDDTVLLSINGTVGNLAFYRGEPVVLGKSAAYIACSGRLDRVFLYYFLQSNQTAKYFDIMLTGTTIRNLSLSSIRAMPVVVPTAGEQLRIAEPLEVMDSLICMQVASLQNARSTKSGLMHDLLTVRVRVSDDTTREQNPQ